MSEEKDYQELAAALAGLSSSDDEDEYYDEDDYISPADGYYGADAYCGDNPYASDDDDDDEDDFPAAMDDGFDGDNVVLCVSNGYTKKYYFNSMFSNIPKEVQDELKIMCVWFTEECGGILTLEFDDDGSLLIKQTTSEYDGYYDQIGSELKINQMRREKKEFLMALELYYKAVVLGMSAEEIEASYRQED